MGRKKAVDLFPEYARSKRADTEALSQLVLAAKGNMTMKKFANKCGVNTSTISRIINMKTETVCSDEIILAISENAVPESGVTLEDLLAANGLIKMVPEIADSTIEEAGSALEGEHKFNCSDRVIVTTSKFGHLSHINKQAFRQTYNIVDYEIRMMETSRQIILNEIILNGYTVELITSEKAYWSSLKHYYGDYAIKTDSLKSYGIDTWLFDCKSYHTGKVAAAYKALEKLFALAYMNSPKDAGLKISVVVDHKDMFQQAVKVYSGIKVRDCFSVILINAQSRCVVEEFCIPRVDGTEASIFKRD